MGSRHEIVQIFINLFINACDAIDGAGGHLRLRSEEKEGRLLVRVSDDGPGMSEEVRSRAFDLFYTTKPGTKGSGLGLGIVHNIVAGHGGTIVIESAPGAGCHFILDLPSADPA